MTSKIENSIPEKSLRIEQVLLNAPEQFSQSDASDIQPLLTAPGCQNALINNKNESLLSFL